MSKVVIEIKNKPKEGDVLIFKDGQFVCIQDKMFLFDTNIRVNECEQLISKLQKEMKEMKKEINILKGVDEDVG